MAGIVYQALEDSVMANVAEDATLMNTNPKPKIGIYTNEITLTGLEDYADLVQSSDTGLGLKLVSGLASYQDSATGDNVLHCTGSYLFQPSGSISTLFPITVHGYFCCDNGGTEILFAGSFDPPKELSSTSSAIDVEPKLRLPQGALSASGE